MTAHAQTAPIAAPVAKASDLATVPTLRHGFFGRPGGVSTGIYSGLNVGSGSRDAPEAVAENRARVARHFGVGVDHLVSAWQVHSPTALLVDAPWRGDRPQGDALVTATPGLALCILTADCAPVLLADPEVGVIAAAHAGWRGAWSGVLEATLEMMGTLGARRANVLAAIGPCIHQSAYEVGPEFADQVLSSDAWARGLFIPGKADRLMFDLPAYVAGRLQRAGVARIETSGQCTFASADLSFSHRRSLSEKASDYGRNASVICLMT